MADETNIRITATDETGSAINSVKRNLESLRGSTTGVGQSFTSMGGMAQAAVTGIAGGLTMLAGGAIRGAIDGFKEMAAGAVENYAQFERMSLSIHAMAAKEALLSGSASNMAQAMDMTAESAKKTVDWIEKVAIHSPFGEESVVQGFRMAQTMGFNTQEAMRLTKATVDWATATGASGDAIGRVENALGLLRTTGKVSERELLELMHAGVDVGRILKENFHISAASAKDFEKAGISADQVIKAVLTDTEKLYGGASERSASSMAGLLTSLDQLGKMSQRNLFSGIIQSVQPYVDQFVSVLSSDQTQALISSIGTKLGAGLTGGINEMVKGVQSVSTALQPLLDAKAPAWLVGLQALTASTGKPLDTAPLLALLSAKAPEWLVGVQALAQLSGTTFDAAPILSLLNAGAPAWVTAIQTVAALSGKPLDITISPTITTIKTPDGGLTVDVNAETKEVKITTAEGKTITLTGVWEKSVLGSLLTAAQDAANAKKILLTAGWTENAASTLTTLINLNDITAKVRPVLEFAPMSAGFNLGEQVGKSINWDEYKTKWQTTLTDWNLTLSTFKFTMPNILPKIDWGNTWNETHETKTAASMDWGPIWTTVYGVMAKLVSFDWGSLWSTVYPVNAQVNVTTYGGSDYSIYGSQMGVQNTAGSGLGGWGNEGFSEDAAVFYGTGSPAIQSNKKRGRGFGGVAPYVSAVRQAVGTSFFGGGLAVVGEVGPELVMLPRGAAVLSNRDSKAMFGGLLPHFADGTVDSPTAFGNALRSGINALSRLFGIQAEIGPPAPGHAAWNDFMNTGKNAMQAAAKTAGDAFSNAAHGTAKDWKGAIQNALGKVPGLFGTSQVTDEQMRLAKAGVPQNFADDYIRRLSDEVLNGKHWEGVDIKDAARRAGIDPNLPNQIILDLVKEAWNNQSFFANKANLSLINMDAVKKSLQQQQAEAQGKENLMALFGLGDAKNQAQIDALGQGISALFGQAVQGKQMKQVGVASINTVMAGMADPGAVNAGMSNVAAAMAAATGSKENAAAFISGGERLAGYLLQGIANIFKNTTLPTPGGVTAPTAPARTIPTVPAKAVGTDYWYGGMVSVHKDETLYLPRGTRIKRPGEGGGMGTTVNNYVTINQKIDEEAFLAKMARRLRAGR